MSSSLSLEKWNFQTSYKDLLKSQNKSLEQQNKKLGHVPFFYVVLVNKCVNNIGTFFVSHSEYI